MIEMKENKTNGLELEWTDTNSVLQCCLKYSERFVSFDVFQYWIDKLEVHHPSIPEAIQLLKRINSSTSTFLNVALHLTNVRTVPIRLRNFIQEYISPKLIAISFNSCKELSWNNEIKRFLSTCFKLEVLKVVRTPQLDESILEQFSIRFQKTLVELHLENLPLLNNKAIYEFARRCNGLRRLKLIACPKLSDLGLLEVTKGRIGLQEIVLAHCPLLTDKSVESLISNCRSLVLLHLIDLPQLTDRSFNALYEGVFSWGKRRNTETNQVKDMQIKALPLITRQSLAWLSASCSNLQTLTVTDCSRIQIGVGLPEIVNLTSLKQLTIGPAATHPKFPDKFDQAMFNTLCGQVGRLEALTLIGLPGISDADLARLLEAANPNILHTLSLRDLKVGTLTVEALCSFIPGIQNLEITDSADLADIDMRCLASVCRNLLSLSLQRCPRLTDIGFTRCQTLKLLRTLSLRELPNCSTRILRYFPGCLLRSLVLDGIPFLQQEDEPRCPFLALNGLNCSSLQEISLRGCVGITLSDLTCALEQFLRMQSLNLENCHLNSKQLLNLNHFNPFLQYIEDEGTEFKGFALKGEAGQLKFERFWQRQVCHRQWHAVRRIQRFRRKILAERERRKKGNRLGWIHLKNEYATTIQRLYRGCRGRKIARTRWSALQKIQNFGQIWRLKKIMQKYLRARRLRHFQLKRALLRMLQKIQVRLVQQECEQIRTLSCRIVILNMKRTLRLWREVLIASEERRTGESVSVFRDETRVKVTFLYWTKIMYETKTRNKKLVKIFLACGDLKCFNSFRQLDLLRKAINFHRRNLLLPPWRIIAVSALRARAIAAKEPAAIAHYLRRFCDRIARLCFDALAQHRLSKRYKREKLRMALAEYPRLLLAHYFEYRLVPRIAAIEIMRDVMEKTDGVRSKYLSRILISRRMVPFTTRCFQYRYRIKKAALMCTRYMFRSGWRRLCVGMLWSRKIRRLDKIAERARDRRRLMGTFTPWTQLKRIQANRGALLYRIYLLRVCKKCVIALSRHSLAKRELIKKLKLEIESRATHSGVDLTFVLSQLTRLQAIQRGRMARSKFAEIRISKLYAIQSIQNFVRGCLARKVFRHRVRLQHLKDLVISDRELDLMREAETEKRYFDYRLKAVVTMQRAVRGLFGRRKFLKAYQEAVVQRGAEFVAHNAHIRDRHEQYLKILVIKEHQREKAAVLIQKRMRGVLARMAFVHVKRRGLIHKKAIVVQTEYRRRLAQQRLEALKRDSNSYSRYKAARKQRGFLMRSFGLNNRYMQARVAVGLKLIGLDPFSFNYRVGELFAETINDFKSLGSIILREIALLPLSRPSAIDARKKAIVAQGWKLKVYDAVRIIESRHPYEGMTGVIVRIDDSLPGKPLYEIKLDRSGRITHVRMTTEPLLIYLNSQPITKIRKRPRLLELRTEHEIFGLDPDDPDFAENRVAAAWTLQRAYRRFRARKIAARRRFEIWLRSVDRQWTVQHHLSDCNAQSKPAYSVLKMLGLLPKRPVHFDEIEQPLLPPRFFVQAKKEVKEKNIILQEVNNKHTDRIAFLQKASILKLGDIFAFGYQKLTKTRKILQWMGFRGGNKKTPSQQALEAIHSHSSGALLGSRGLRSLSHAKKTTSISGTDIFCFPQFEGSPHVRYHKSVLYQGEWAGVPLLTPMLPHGEGEIVFLDGWGFGREEKVLYITIIRCKYLNAMDIATAASDPYCLISCNGTTVQTSVQWANLNPEFKESFEIDVTNPGATVSVVVMDKDSLGSDDFMGQVVFNLSDFADGKEHSVFEQLRDENNIKRPDDDRGEIELIIRWAERVYEDDFLLLEKKRLMAIRLQSWTRRLSAKYLLRRLRRERQENEQHCRLCAIKVTSVCRMRIAKKKLNFLKRLKRSAIKIQKRIRIFIAKRCVILRRKSRRAAVIIQTRMRVVLAKNAVMRIRMRKNARVDFLVTRIQKMVRKRIACLKVFRLRKERGDFDSKSSGNRKKVKGGGLKGEDAQNHGVSSWIKTYGRDSEYGLKRNRRITERAFKKLLTMKFTRLLTTKLGIVYVENYPLPNLELRETQSAQLPNQQGKQKQQQQQQRPLSGAAKDKPKGKKGAAVPVKTQPTSTTLDPPVADAAVAETVTDQPPARAGPERSEFVSVFLPCFNPRNTRRDAALTLLGQHSFLAILHIPSAVLARRSVDFAATIIQCLHRQRSARGKFRQMLRIHRSISLFQRIFRRRKEKYQRAAFKITAIIRRKIALDVTRLLARELAAAKIIQGAYRCYRARSELFDLISVNELSVLRSPTPFVPSHGPERALEHRSDTFWMAMSKEFAEVKVEFARVENIKSIWVMTSTYNSSPQYISVSVVLRKDARKYVEIIPRTELPNLKEHRWHAFPIPLTAAKYFKVSFYFNYGNPDHMAVRQIRFVRAREKSATIVSQPQQHVMAAGPAVNETATITLTCLAEGWPLPAFQWYYNKKKIPGAVKNELRISLHCAGIGIRSFRCTRCRMVSKTTPANAYHVKCGNCGYMLAYKDVEEYDLKVAAIRAEENEIMQQRHQLETTQRQLEVFKKETKYLPIIEECKEKIAKVDIKMTALREARVALKESVRVVNRFTGEGIYTCHVSNIRGGGVRIKRKSELIVVLVEQSVPYVVAAYPHYEPRTQIFRKKWPIYSSLYGTFRRGRVEGIVTIRFKDGSFYEGPYVEEVALDSMGCSTLKSARPRDHYGFFQTGDGRIFEGANVDNHFNQFNIQFPYRLTMPNKEIYVGEFCDEMFHGVGMYTYKDGSVYEGRWHRGTRFGHGHFRSNEGWTYEGFYDSDRRHRQGIITWPDGSCYMGDWYYDTMQGNGIYITALRDLYRGEVKDGYFHGFGDMIYADTSRYVGEFKFGYRDGKGIFTEKEGNSYFGHFVKDLKEGEHICKVMIDIEELGQDNFEIRIGQFSKGDLVKWKSKFANPLITRQFINLFKGNREMFDSVYSMILAKNLPNLPDGIDPFNDHVKNIILRIRKEAGMLVGEHALRTAQAKVDELLGPLKSKNNEREALKHEIETVSIKVIDLQNELSTCRIRADELMHQYEKSEKKIEQFWADEPNQVRAKFQKACACLKDLTVEEFFAFRNHRVVPIFTQKIVDTISMLLKMPKIWKQQQLLYADSVTNVRNGDEEASRFVYHCKLYHLSQNYPVYAYCDLPNLAEIEFIVSDARFRKDSYYIESTGVAGPFLVDWAKTNLAYLKAAKKIEGTLKRAEEKKMEALRLRIMAQNKQKELDELKLKQQHMQDTLKELMTFLQELDIAVSKAQDLLQFVSQQFKGEFDSQMDYYRELEAKIEQRKDRFTVEICIQGMLQQCEERAQEELRKKRRDALAMGQSVNVIDEVKSAGLLKDWIHEEVRSQQQDILNSERTLGYGFKTGQGDVDPPGTVTRQYTSQVVSLVVDLLIGRLNDAFNDRASSLRWVGLRGRTFTSRFLYVLVWCEWERLAIKIRDDEAEVAWEKIFGPDPSACAKMAIESRTNVRMSNLAREQAKVWSSRHPLDVEVAERNLCDEFASTYPEDTATQALYTMMDTSGQVSPSLKAMASSWLRLNPDHAAAARDVYHGECAEQFASYFNDKTAETAFKILNGWGSVQEMQWLEHADHWRAFNMDTYSATAEQQLAAMAQEFQENRSGLGDMSGNVALDAVKVIDLLAIARSAFDLSAAEYMLEERVPSVAEARAAVVERALLGAHCWSVKNQGKVRKARYALQNGLKNDFTQSWNDLTRQTENFTKGSLLAQTANNNSESSPGKFAGFRQRLLRKYGWMYGYLIQRQQQIQKELQTLELEDPLHKVVHRVRPSQMQKVMRAREESFLKKRSHMDSELADALNYLSQWHSYFGQPSEKKDLAMRGKDKDKKAQGDVSGKGKMSLQQQKQLENSKDNVVKQFKGAAKDNDNKSKAVGKKKK